MAQGTAVGPNGKISLPVRRYRKWVRESNENSGTNIVVPRSEGAHVFKIQILDTHGDFFVGNGSNGRL
jgi:hypothetical protein